MRLLTTADPAPSRPPDVTPLVEDLARGLADVPWLDVALRVCVAIAVALLVHLLVFRGLRRVARRTDTAFDATFVGRLARPAAVLLPLLALQFVLPSITAALATEQAVAVRHVTSLLTVFAMTWLVIAAIHGGADLIRGQYDVSVSDNYAARRMHTQVAVLSRIAVIAAVIVGTGLALMTFPRVRELGTSLLASAGIIGIIVGFAARPVLENVIAGLQLAMTQPINIDDVVIIDGEWGRVEQITSTYVVVRIWDDRRLICPFSKFITESFQNWTRRTSDILGTVFLFADYTVPVDAVRAELKRIVEGHDNWDGRACALQVTDATPDALQLRAIVSASSASDAWDLRVDVREKLVAFLQREHPDCLPRTRVTLAGRSDPVGADAPPARP